MKSWGYSLLELMLTAGLSSIVILAGNTILKTQSKNQVENYTESEIQPHLIIVKDLLDKNLCSSNMLLNKKIGSSLQNFEMGNTVNKLYQSNSKLGLIDNEKNKIRLKNLQFFEFLNLKTVENEQNPSLALRRVLLEVKMSVDLVISGRESNKEYVFYQLVNLNEQNEIVDCMRYNSSLVSTLQDFNNEEKKKVCEKSGGEWTYWLEDKEERRYCYYEKNQRYEMQCLDGAPVIGYDLDKKSIDCAKRSDFVPVSGPNYSPSGGKCKNNEFVCGVDFLTKDQSFIAGPFPLFQSINNFKVICCGLMRTSNLVNSCAEKSFYLNSKQCGGFYSDSNLSCVKSNRLNYVLRGFDIVTNDGSKVGSTLRPSYPRLCSSLKENQSLQSVSNFLVGFDKNGQPLPGESIPGNPLRCVKVGPTCGRLKCPDGYYLADMTTSQVNDAGTPLLNLNSDDLSSCHYGRFEKNNIFPFTPIPVFDYRRSITCCPLW